MTISVKHAFASAKSDSGDPTLVQPSNWNAEHSITAAASKVLGRDASGAGAIQELPLSFDATGQSMVPPSGTTGARPASPIAGMFRYNTTTGAMEAYFGATWQSWIVLSANIITTSMITDANVTTAKIADAGVTTAKIADAAVTLAKLDTTVTQGLVPAGAIVDFAGATAPTGWLLCYGQAVSRSTYAALFTAISTVHGVGDGSTTFNLPDYRGRVGAGKDNMGGTSADRLTAPSTVGSIDGDVLGNTGGQEAHTQTLAELVAHTHNTQVGNLDSPDTIAAGGSNAVNNVATGSQGSSSPANVVQPTIILNKIIKT